MSVEAAQGVAYGSLYLDQGERMEVVKKQIKSFVKHKPVAMFFDVLDNNNTVTDEVGNEYVERVKAYATKMLPDTKISCSFSRAD